MTPLSLSLGEMMAQWFAAMQKSIDALNQTMLAVLDAVKKGKDS